MTDLIDGDAVEEEDELLRVAEELGIGKQLATVDRAGSLDGLSTSDVLARIRKVREIASKVMEDGVHFGVIPGVRKPTLFKAGAEVLCVTFQLDPEYTIVENRDGRAGENGHLEVVVTCTLHHIPTGLRVASAIGSCSTLESKYAQVESSPTCPACGATAVIKGRAEYGGGWLCFLKKGGCGMKFADGTDIVATFEASRGKRDRDRYELADVYNTVRKMAVKRAQVAAVLSATGASEQFTQDVEDLGPAGEEQAGPSRPAATAAAEKESVGIQPETTETPISSGAATEPPVTGDRRVGNYHNLSAKEITDKLPLLAQRTDGPELLKLFLAEELGRPAAKQRVRVLKLLRQLLSEPEDPAPEEPAPGADDQPAHPRFGEETENPPDVTLERRPLPLLRVTLMDPGGQVVLVPPKDNMPRPEELKALGYRYPKDAFSPWPTPDDEGVGVIILEHAEKPARNDTSGGEREAAGKQLAAGVDAAIEADIKTAQPAPEPGPVELSKADALRNALRRIREEWPDQGAWATEEKVLARIRETGHGDHQSLDTVDEGILDKFLSVVPEEARA